jgi:hypothetical protein
MDQRDLREALDWCEVRRDVYSLEGSPIENTLCLDRDGRGWIVFFLERGERGGLRSFATEHDACEYVFAKLASDPTARSDDGPHLPPPW